MGSIYAQMAKGAVWMVAFKLLDRVVGLCSIAVLARLLEPADFGLVALATATIAALELLGAFSFDVALIQRRDAERGHYDTAWTFNVCVGVLTSVLTFLLAEPAAAFYGEPRLENVLHVLSLVPIVGALESIGVVAFRKEMRFDREFAFMISKRLVMTLVTVVCAFYWKNYQALMAGIVAGKAFGTVLSYVITGYWPRLTLSHRRDLFHFSVWMFVNNILSFFSNKFSAFVLGKTVKAEALGVYNLATEIAFLPTTELVAPINRVVFPAYAKMGSDVANLAIGYLRVTGMVALFAIPAALGLAMTADVFVPLVFGNKWLSAVPIIQLLAVFGALQALQNNIYNVLYGLGKPRTNTMFSIAHNAMMIPLLIWFSMQWGVMGACYALLLAGVALTPFAVGVTLRLLRLSWGALGSILWRPVVGGSVMALGLFWIKRLLAEFSPNLNVFVELPVLVGCGAVLYLSAICMLWIVASRPEGAEQDAMAMIKRVLGSRQKTA